MIDYNATASLAENHLRCDDNAASLTIAALRGANGARRLVNTADRRLPGPFPGTFGQWTTPGAAEGIVVPITPPGDYPMTLTGWATREDNNYAPIVAAVSSSRGSDYLSFDHNRPEGFPAIVARAGAGPSIVQSDTAFPYSTWVHFAAVFRSPTDREYYMNGVSVATASASILFPTDIDTLSLKFLNRNAPGTAGSGGIYDVMRFNLALSVPQIVSLMQNPLASPGRRRIGPHASASWMTPYARQRRSLIGAR